MGCAKMELKSCPTLNCLNSYMRPLVSLTTTGWRCAASDDVKVLEGEHRKQMSSRNKKNNSSRHGQLLFSRC